MALDINWNLPIFSLLGIVVYCPVDVAYEGFCRLIDFHQSLYKMGSHQEVIVWIVPKAKVAQSIECGIRAIRREARRCLFVGT